jgi:hypothetical protein
MGLDTTHDCWHGAYSAFSRWRQKIAKAAGYAVWNVKYDDGITIPTVMLDWGHIPDGAMMGEWDKPQSDPLVYLIAHCDCEGIIKPEQAGPLAARLREIVPLLPDEDNGGHIGNWRAKTMQFIEGLEDAVAKGENVEFH